LKTYNYFNLKLLIIVLSTLSLNSISQEISESYLESLPDGVKNDVLKEIRGKKEKEADIYRRASTMTQKQGSMAMDDLDDEDLIDYQDYLDYVAEQKRIRENKVERFGFNIFDSMQSSFMPINEPNIDGSYVLDYGDVLEIQIIGDMSEQEMIDVRRDGSISIEDVGKIYVAGLSLEKASNLIESKIKEAYIGAESYVSIVGLRDIQILVSGDAFNPGIYTVSGNSNALHVLSMAGGIGKDGSYRNIEIIRDGNKVQSIDLYEVFIYGKSSYGRRLRSGDSILIKPAENLVKIEGGIKRPFIYELKENESFEDLISFANGFKDNVDLSYVVLDSLNKGEVVSQSTNIKDLYSVTPKSGDSLFIGQHKFIKVKISGSVKSPGLYTLSENDSLSDLINRSGGYIGNAYPFGGILNNKRSKEMNKFANDQVYENLIKFLATPQLQASQGDKQPDFQYIGFMLQELKKIPVSGRVMAEFDIDEIITNPSKDTSLEDGDEVIIPTKTQQVYVFGEVNSPGTLRYKPGQDFQYYIKNKGGLNNFANDKQLFVVYPNGQTYALKSSALFGFNALSDDVLIYPGSVIYVPRNISISSTQTAAIWAPILSSMAVTLTSLSVLND